MSNKKLLAIATGAALLAGAQGASAAVGASGQADYSVTLTASCEIDTAGAKVSFGTFNLGGADQTGVGAGKVDARCSAGVPFEILFDGGLNQDLGLRRMSDGITPDSFVPYVLYNAATALEVGDATSLTGYTSSSPMPYPGISVSGTTNTGTWMSFPLVADVWISAATVAGTYTDSVKVSVVY